MWYKETQDILYVKSAPPHRNISFARTRLPVASFIRFRVSVSTETHFSRGLLGRDTREESAPPDSRFPLLTSSRRDSNRDWNGRPLDKSPRRGRPVGCRGIDAVRSVASRRTHGRWIAAVAGSSAVGRPRRSPRRPGPLRIRQSFRY